MNTPSALLNAAQKLSSCGYENARNEVRWLWEFSSGEPTVFDSMIEKRISGIPLVRILREQPFYENIFTVRPGVFAPRAETEILVDVALASIRGLPSPRILDIGVGTGVILLSLLAKRNDAIGIGIDIATAAIQNAEINASRMKLSDRATFRCGTLERVDAVFDLVVTNPPYIADSEYLSLPPEVRNFDPKEALTSGSDGLQMIHAILIWAKNNLKKNGHLVFEFGYGQAERVKTMLGMLNYNNIQIVNDLSKIPRVAVSQPYYIPMASE